MVILATSRQKQRAEEEFRLASNRLRERIPKKIQAELKKVVIPDLNAIDGVEPKMAELENCIETFLASRTEYLENRGRLEVIKSTVGEWYREFYPFANLVLGIGKESAEVTASSSMSVTE